MKRLTTQLMEPYEIENVRPEAITAVQFGDDPLLMGLVDRLLDDANRAGARFGVACVQTPGGHAEALRAQDGLYTVFVRGESGEKRVQREQVVQCVLRAIDPEGDDEALMALGASAEVRLVLTGLDAVNEFARRDASRVALLARFLLERWRAGIEPPECVVCAETARADSAVRAAFVSLSRQWGAGEDFDRWLGAMPIRPALADCLTNRCDAQEAARLCETMNYADAMIHFAEPDGVLAIQADEAFARAFRLEGVEGVQFVEDISQAIEWKHRLFDAGLFTLTAAGLLRGCDTLADCMKDEPLRELAGRALMDEIMPYAPFERDRMIPYIVRCYERYSNPMNLNRLEWAGRGLIHRFRWGVLPAMRAGAEQNGTPPERLTAALAGAVLLLADARETDGAWETIVGEERVPIHEEREILEAFSRLSSDMEADSLAYAVLSDRDLWLGDDLRNIEGLAEKLAENLGA